MIKKDTAGDHYKTGRGDCAGSGWAVHQLIIGHTDMPEQAMMRVSLLGWKML